MTRKYLALLVALPLLLAGCGGDDEPEADATVGGGATEETTTDTATESESPSPTTDDSGSGTAGGEVTVELADAGSLGQVLVDGEGMTLYMFDPDAQGASTCYDKCEEAWPPLIGEATAGEGVDEAMFGTVERTDGSQQVTYNKWPLYFFTPDEAAGDVKGQAVNDVWWVLGADGVPIKTPAS